MRDPERLKAMYIAYQRMSLAEVGNMFGMSRQAVHKTFRKHGLLTRGHDYHKAIRAAKAADSGRN